jgi:hypothetical protein
MDLTVETIEALAKLVTAHRLDSLKVGELELVKSQHDVIPLKRASKPPKTAQPTDPDELLYWSSQAPKMTAAEDRALREAMNEDPHGK